MIALQNDDFYFVKKLVKHDKFDPDTVNKNGETVGDICRYE